MHVRRAVVELADGSLVTGWPKTNAGRRVVGIPEGLLPEVVAHLAEFTGDRLSSLVFVGPKGAPMRRSNFQTYWTDAVEAAGVKDVHFHDLRHTGNTLAAQAGATYLHTTFTRDRVIADRLSTLIPPTDRARNGHEEAESITGPNDA